MSPGDAFLASRMRLRIVITSKRLQVMQNVCNVCKSLPLSLTLFRLSKVLYIYISVDLSPWVCSLVPHGVARPALTLPKMKEFNSLAPETTDVLFFDRQRILFLLPLLLLHCLGTRLSSWTSTVADASNCISKQIKFPKTYKNNASLSHKFVLFVDTLVILIPVHF